MASIGNPDGVELLLEPTGHPVAAPFKEALVADGIPFTQLAVDDVYAEAERLKALGVDFTQDATDSGQWSLPSSTTPAAT